LICWFRVSAILYCLIVWEMLTECCCIIQEDSNAAFVLIVCIVCVLVHCVCF